MMNYSLIGLAQNFKVEIVQNSNLQRNQDSFERDIQGLGQVERGISDQNDEL
jgi:hypothetical protein